MKTYIIFIFGTLASCFSWLFGGLDNPLLILISLMGLDYFTGLIIAKAGKSLKTENGGLSSYVGFLGLAKKFVILFFVIVGHMCDALMGLDFCRLTVIYGYVANEILSLVENAGILGLPIPSVISNCIEVLKSKGEEVHE